VVLSANDVAVAIAEAIGGTESHFSELMTAKARSWGMTHTFFHNASGLPDDLQLTSAGDLGILARHLAYDFPQYFHYFSTYSFTWRGATHYTHDNLIGALRWRRRNQDRLYWSFGLQSCFVRRSQRRPHHRRRNGRNNGQAARH